VRARAWARSRAGVTELMTLCGHVGVNDALCNREKDAVFLIENAGERASGGALVIGTLRRCTELTRPGIDAST